MATAALQRAQHLLKEKKYDEARAILKTISEHPTAQKWLAKLDEIAPERPTLDDDRDEFARLLEDADEPSGERDAASERFSALRSGQVRVGNPDLRNRVSSLLTHPLRSDQVHVGNPDSNDPSRPKAKRGRFAALATIATLYKILGALVGLAAASGAAVSLYDALFRPSYYSGFAWGQFFGFAIGGSIAAVSLYAGAQLIDLLLSVEANQRETAENTRRTAELLERLEELRG